jgi:alkanesulfonate monooxygenase SsuD/methylene tetrahydromethanopterin reductase-like flavin-dependent oxidoreductase (luciferase family)
LTIVRALWAGEPVNLEGRVFRVRGAQLAPRPVQRPGPPIWLAAMRPRALALAARLADGWEASYVTPTEFAALAARLDGFLASAGRAAGSIRRSIELDVVLVASAAARETAVRRFCAERRLARGDRLLDTALIGDLDAVVARIAEYAAAGVTDLMLGFTDFPATTMLERLGPALPRVAALRPEPGRGR